MIRDEICEVDGLLLRGFRIIIPKSLKKQVLLLSHEGHPGITSIKNRLRSKMWWPGLDKDVENFVKTGKGFQLVQIYPTPAYMKRRVMPSWPWKNIAIDFKGPLPSGDYIFVVVDYYNRFFEDTIAVLKVIFPDLEFQNQSQQTMVLNSGKAMSFLNFVKNYGIRLFSTTPYWPQENGEVERQNRSILKKLTVS